LDATVLPVLKMVCC